MNDLHLRVGIALLAMGFSFFFASRSEAADWPAAASLPSQGELPDPLLMFDGAKINSVSQWNQERRPQLKELFQHYMYGYLPDAPKIKAKIKLTNEKFLAGKATLKLIDIELGPKDCPTIELLLVVPNKRQGPVPVILGLNFEGNHTVHSDPAIPLSTRWMRNGDGVVNNRATEKTRASQADRWEIENTIDQGFAVATIFYGDILPDKNDLNDGVLPFFRKTQEASATDMRAIAGWAWGLHRAVDFLVTDKDIDAKSIVVFGHSRNGKAALVAGAFDDRIAVTIAHQAGCGGSAPSRTTNPKAEPVKRINTSFPHWFNENFKLFNDATDKLPFDQHGLVAICAPRAVLFTNGEKDQWADPAGQLRILKAASPVYELMGVKGIAANAEAKHGDIIGDTLGYFVDEGAHTVTKEHWNVFIKFAKRQLGSR